MSPLKNLASIRKNIARRIRQALDELQENLARERVAVPVPVPVPMRGGRRILRTAQFPLGGIRMAAASRGPFSPFHSSRFYSTYSQRFSGFSNMRWRNINGSLMFQNFSSRGLFRLRLFHTFYKAPTLTELLKKKMGICDKAEHLWKHRMRSTYPQATAMARVPLDIRLHSLLTQKFHDMVMELARPAEEADGCFVDFTIAPKVLIPAATMMSAEVLNELLANLKHFEKHLVELQADLARLSELGELPLRFVAASNIIRVYFPNCDRDRLEALLLEKNVLSGVVYEDVSRECESVSSDELSSVSEFDILSSCNLLTLLSGSESSYDDVLSSTSGSDAQDVEIFEEESYHWA